RSIDELLVSIVQNHQNLYNKQNEHYKDEEHKRNSWLFIAKSLEMDADTAKKRWDNLRDRFVRAYRDYCDNPEAAIKASKFKLFDQMLWLAPYIRKRRITSTIAATQKKLNTLFSTSDVINSETQDTINLKTEIQSASSETTLHESYDYDDGLLASSASFSEQEKIENKSDHYFMMSIIHDCQSLSPRKKLKFKRDVLGLLEKYLYED
ncbi:transcription factor Adf-1-like, partial [Asbolus verrucosus]